MLCHEEGRSMADRIRVTPLLPHFAARVEGVELKSMNGAVFKQVFDAFQEHSVLVFHEQRLSDEEQMSFSRRFGPLEESIKAPGKENRLHHNLIDLSNIDPEQDGKLIDWKDRRMLYQSGNQLWHSDSSFKPVPAMASLLSARGVPPVGGETEFASMRHAYATLPAEMQRRLEDKIAVHSILYSRHTIAPNLFDPDQADELPPVRQALVRANPVNGRKSIYVGSHAWYIEGLGFEESRRLLDDLLAHATRPETVYQHRWQPWDLVMWDNRCALHRGRPWDAGRHKRVMRRTTIAGEGPTAEPPFARRAPQWQGIIAEGVGV
jgi:alpha-ketoglutarate-dependent 2,4-dichlorophenoxyacetate dioxygenase